MENYKSLIDAIDDLRLKGYTIDFDLQPNGLYDPSAQLQLHPEQFTIDAYFRFEGQTNPDDSSVIYAISSQTGSRGLLIDAYGVYAENLTPEMAAKIVKH